MFTVVFTDGTRRNISLTLADQVAAESTARTRKWGGATEAPIQFAAFACFKALKRADEFAGDYDEFLNAVATVEEVETADPE